MKRLVLALIFSFLACTVFGGDGLVLYTNTPSSVSSVLYSLTVNGRPVFVEKFKDVSYARFAFSGTVSIEVKVAGSLSKYSLSPLSYSIDTKHKGNAIAFTLTQPRKLILQIEGLPEKLFILADAPEQGAPKLGAANVISLLDFVSDREGSSLQTAQIQKAIDQASVKHAVLYVPNGKYLTGTLVMRKNVTLYLQSGALLQGSDKLEDYNDNGDNSTGKVIYGKGALIYFDHADNASICGRGVIDGNGTRIKAQGPQKIRICNLRTCQNASLVDVLIRDAAGFNIHILNSKNILMKGYKIINDLSLPNQDGTDPDGCDGVVVDDVFMYTSDDAIAVKADHQLCQNIIVKNCVFWTVKSALKVGSDPYFNARNISFINNDVVYADRALALYAGKGSIEDVKFIDNRSEFVGGNSKRQLMVFQVSNSKEEESNPDRKGIGSINHVLVENYTAYQQSEHKSLISGTVGKDGTIHRVTNIVFKNLVIEGKKCMSADEAKISLSPKELPVDPNVAPKDVAKQQVVLREAIRSIDHIVFE